METIVTISSSTLAAPKLTMDKLRDIPTVYHGWINNTSNAVLARGTAKLVLPREGGWPSRCHYLQVVGAANAIISMRILV